MNDDRLKKKLLRVDPISQNEDWINRLSKIPFIVDAYDKPIQAEGERRIKRKRKLNSVSKEGSSSSDE